MKLGPYLLLLGGLWAGITSLSAQDDKYLDDTYLSREEVKARQAKAKAEAAKERAERAEQMARWRETELKRQAELIKAQRSREIDAYNGHLTHEDSIALMQHYGRAVDRIQSDEIPQEGYGEYSNRLRRFGSTGNVVIINNPYGAYAYDDVWAYPSRWGSSWYGWGSYDPWWDDYYYPSRWGSSWSWGWGWGGSRYGFYGYYDPWYRSRYGFYGYYDPWYSGYYDPYWGGYYPYSWSYYPGYYYPSYGYVTRRSSYRSGSRSAANPTVYQSSPYTSYGAYESARGRIDAGQSYNTGRAYGRYDGNSSVGTSYRGVGRSAYGSGSGNYNSRYEVDRSQARSVYSEPTNSGSSYSAPARSYGGGSSGGARGRR